MQHHQHRLASASRQPGQAVEQRDLMREIEMARRLVEQQQIRAPARAAPRARRGGARRRRACARRALRRRRCPSPPARRGAIARSAALSHCQRDRCGCRPTSAVSSTVAGNASLSSCGSSRAAARARAATHCASGRPASSIVPAAAGRNPASVCNSVVLPAPLRPRIAQHSPARTRKSRLRHSGQRGDARPSVRARESSAVSLIARAAAGSGTPARRSAR